MTDAFYGFTDGNNIGPVVGPYGTEEERANYKSLPPVATPAPENKYLGLARTYGPALVSISTLFLAATAPLTVPFMQAVGGPQAPACRGELGSDGWSRNFAADARFLKMDSSPCAPK